MVWLVVDSVHGFLKLGTGCIYQFQSGSVYASWDGTVLRTRMGTDVVMRVLLWWWWWRKSSIGRLWSL